MAGSASPDGPDMPDHVTLHAAHDGSRPASKNRNAAQRYPPKHAVCPLRRGAKGARTCPLALLEGRRVNLQHRTAGFGS